MFKAPSPEITQVKPKQPAETLQACSVAGEGEELAGPGQWKEGGSGILQHSQPGQCEGLGPLLALTLAHTLAAFKAPQGAHQLGQAGNVTGDRKKTNKQTHPLVCIMKSN